MCNRIRESKPSSAADATSLATCSFRVTVQGAGCAGALGSMHQPQASSAPAGAQLGGLDLMAILQNAGVRPIPQPQPHPGVKQESTSSMQVDAASKLHADQMPARFIAADMVCDKP